METTIDILIPNVKSMEAEFHPQNKPGDDKIEGGVGVGVRARLGKSG